MLYLVDLCHDDTSGIMLIHVVDDDVNLKIKSCTKQIMEQTNNDSVVYLFKSYKQ